MFVKILRWILFVRFCLWNFVRKIFFMKFCFLNVREIFFMTFSSWNFVREILFVKSCLLNSEICFLFLSSKKSVKFNRIFQINHRALRCHVSITERVKTCNSWMCQIDKSTTFLVIIQFDFWRFLFSHLLWVSSSLEFSRWQWLSWC